MTELTPYDTGEVAEAKPWLPYGTEVTEITPASNFGKVDFDDDAGETVLTARVVRREDGGWSLIIESHVDKEDLDIEYYGDQTKIYNY